MREHVLKVLERRYSEVIVLAKSPIATPGQYNRFLSNLAHYLQYLTKNRLTKRALSKLLHRKTLVNLEKTLLSEKDEIIKKLTADQAKLAKLAKNKGLLSKNTKPSTNSSKLSDKQTFALRFNELSEFIEAKEHSMRDLPNQIGNLRTIVETLRQMGIGERSLKPLADSYGTLQDEFAKKLVLLEVFGDYLRQNDYKELDRVRRYIYQEADSGEVQRLLSDNYDLIDATFNKNYDQKDLANVRQKVEEYSNHLQRLHNYMIDVLEIEPVSERLRKWSLQHFGPTLVSLVIILALYTALTAIFGFTIDVDTIKQWF